MVNLFRKSYLWFLSALGLGILLPWLTMASMAHANSGWSAPGILWQENWDNPLYADLDDAGSRITALIPYGGLDASSRSVMVSEKNGDTWGSHVLVGNNG